MSEKAVVRSSTSGRRQDRDSALYVGLSWVVTLLVPVVIVLTAVRAIMSPLFLQIEYNRAVFPPDPYGFTTEDRLYWSRFALDYLTNSAEISYLGDLRFEDGTPLYNERELSHMVDVKVAVRGAISVLVISSLALLALGAWAWRGGWLERFRQGLVRGGWLTVLLLVTILLAVFFAFGVLFTAFHDVFFQPGTWMFNYSDTLIRLFPERLWQDIFILVGGFSVLVGLGVALLLRRPSE